MRYITSHEEIGIEKGRVQGLHEGLILALEMKFGPEATSLSTAIERIPDLAALERLVHDIRSATSLEAAHTIIAAVTTG